MSIKRIGLAFALSCAAPAAAAPPAEWVGHGPLPGLEIVYQRAGNGSLIVERVPPGETVERWTRMATTQRFAGEIAAGGTLDQWYRGYLTSLTQACPGLRPGPLRRLQIEGRPVIQIRVDCPRNPETGLPETFFLRAIEGRTDLHLSQVAFRSVPSAAETAWALRHVATITLCTPRSPSAVCRAGPEAIDR